MRDDRKQPVRAGVRLPLSHIYRPRAWALALRDLLVVSGEVAVAVALGPPLLLWITLVPALRGLGWAEPVALLAFALATTGVWGALLAGTTYLAGRFEGEDRRRERLVPKGKCAACAFDLSGLAPEPDGCTVCPECGGAWDLARTRRGVRERRWIRDDAGKRHWATAEFQPAAVGQLVVPGRGRGVWAGVLAVWGVLTASGAVLFFVGPPAALWSPMGLPMTWKELGAIVALVGLTGAAVTQMAFARAEGTRRAIAAALAGGRCPACWGEMGEHERVCGSCGARWRIGSPDA